MRFKIAPADANDRRRRATPTRATTRETREKRRTSRDGLHECATATRAARVYNPTRSVSPISGVGSRPKISPVAPRPRRRPERVPPIALRLDLHVPDRSRHAQQRHPRLDLVLAERELEVGDVALIDVARRAARDARAADASAARERNLDPGLEAGVEDVLIRSALDVDAAAAGAEERDRDDVAAVVQVLGEDALRQVDGVARRLILLSAEERARRRRASARVARARRRVARRARRARRAARARMASRSAVVGTPYPGRRRARSPPTATRAMLDAVAAAWDDAVDATSAAIALPRGSTRFLLALALAPAIGLGFPALDRALAASGVASVEARARARSTYALVSGVALSAAAFGGATAVCAHFGAGAYAAMLTTRRRCGVVVFAASFAYLMRYHFVADTARAWKSGEVDISGLLMVLTLKVTACAMNYQDAATTKASEMSEFQNRRHLKRLPSALDYASWLMFPCTLVSGPAIEFRDYSDWLRERGVYARGTPNRVAPATRKFLGAMACLGMYQAVMMRYTVENTYLNPNWARYSLAERLWHVYVYGQGNRAKYYFVWMMADFAATVSGLGFSGYDAMGKACWDTAANIYPIGVEKSVTLNAIPLSWNVKTGLWLRHYVYDRVTPKGKKPGLLQILITQIVSGVWHGLYAGYWLFFVSSAFAVNAGRLMYRWKQTRVPEKYRVLVDVPLWAFTHVCLNYMCAAFILIDLKQCLQSWSSMRYFGHVGIAVLLVFGAVFAPRRSSKPKSA